jgi:3-hydroxyisobutyrate dehydrogenase
MRMFTTLRRHYSATSKVVGFVGLGHMGSPMAQNLAKAGYDVVVHDMDPVKMREFAKHAKSLSELASTCPRIITMLPNNSIVNNVYLGSDGLIAHAKPSSTLIDCSTVSPGVEEKISKNAVAHKVNFLDAPVSGGVKGAAAGTLSFLVGGNRQTFEANKDLFQAMGKNIFHCGGSGSGQSAKICNNLILGVSMVVLSEALHLGGRLGLDPKILSEVINSSSGRSWSSETYNPVPGIMASAPSSSDYRGGFASNLMAKDMMLALEEAQRCGAALPTGEIATEMYRVLSKQMGQKDFSSVFLHIQSISN